MFGIGKKPQPQVTTNGFEVQEASQRVRVARRILILGCCGSGKSRFAGLLAQQLKLPLVRLDDVYWGPHWVRPQPAEWGSWLTTLVSAPCWIIDGNYFPSIDQRLARADLAIVLDFPTRVCLSRTVVRDIRRLLGCRDDLPAAVRDQGGRSGFGSLWLFVLTFRFRVRRALLQRLSKWPGETLIFSSEVQVGAFFNGLAHGSSASPGA